MANPAVVTQVVTEVVIVVGEDPLPPVPVARVTQVVVEAVVLTPGHVGIHRNRPLWQPSALGQMGIHGRTLGV